MDNKIVLGSEGLGYSNAIDEKEVSLCKKWIKKYITPRKTINTKKGSYNLKGLVEKDTSTYISNGAFIKAAIELGYEYKENGKNAYFNMSLIYLQIFFSFAQIFCSLRGWARYRSQLYHLRSQKTSDTHAH